MATTAADDHKTEYPHIVRTPGVLGGSPRVEGTRLAVWAIATLWNQGETLANLLDMFPGLTAAGVHSALAYYWDHRDEVDQQIADNDPENWTQDAKGRWSPKSAAKHPAR